MKRFMERLAAWLLLSIGVASCMFYETKVETAEGDEKARPGNFIVESPAKLHLRDGSVVLYDKGFEAWDGNILGAGERYDLTRAQKTAVTSVPVDEIAFLEHYDRRNRRTISTLTSAAAVGAGTVGSLLLYKALFGSCPTVYSTLDEGLALEAELFSHSTGRRFELDDLDRLEFAAAVDGTLTINLSNEALETHYINRIDLLAVDYPHGYEAFPTPGHGVLLFGNPAQLLEATSRSGDDIRDLVASRDQEAYQSGAELLRSFAQQADSDWIDLSVRVPDGATTMYLALKARNTLFATVFLYDVAMASQGFQSLDWMGSDASGPLYAQRFADWFQQHFSIAVQIRDGETYRTIDSIEPTGPIAWHQVATGIEVPPGEVARIRLSFLPDNWAIDWVGVSFDSSAAIQQTTFTPATIDALRGNDLSPEANMLADRDEGYFITYPGDLYRLDFAVHPVPENMQRSYFIASSGYYIEWLRMSWVADNGSYGPTRTLEFNDELLQQTARLWLDKRDAMQSQFYGTKLPLER